MGVMSVETGRTPGVPLKAKSIMKEKILIIEDEDKMARFIELELVHEGYETQIAYDGRRGLELFESGAFDLILLDIMLPEINGVEVLRRIRKNSQIPVIMLTARDSVMDKVYSLDGGADDYVTKPFAIEELMARVRVSLRKAKNNPPEAQNDIVLQVGGLSLNPKRHTVNYENNYIELTKREFDLLQILLENKDIVLSRETLIEKVWGYDYLGDTNSVDVYIRYLRSKIDEVYNIRLIHTVRGVGYVIKDEYR